MSTPEPRSDVGAAEVQAAVDRMEARMRSPGREKQILVAGVGNAFLADDGFGGAVAAAVERRGVPAGVTVMDFGTGGLDLAYEVMRGYDALVIVDVSRQGGEPGTLYVIEPDEAEVDGAIEDGDPINPHGMDPKTVLRFVKSVGGWPGKVVVVACEPTSVEAMGMELSEDVAAVVERAVDAVFAQVAELQSDRAYGGGDRA
jgi:hydrogenase maturation protease